MDHRKPAAFLSYARADDRHTKGRVVKICELLSNELQAQTGEPFPIFVDRNHIDWGENWESRIYESLEAATLLIPVITPNYFRSSMCRQEFRKFLAKERRIGGSELILPIYYIEAPEMEDPTLYQEDDLAQELARRQYADWRKLRLASLESKRVLETIEGLAQRMRKAVQRGLGATSTKAPIAEVDPAPGVVEVSSKVDQDMRTLSHLYHLDRLASAFHEESDKVTKRHLTAWLTCDDARASVHQGNHQMVLALTTIVAGQQVRR
jgi:hypothetical protein